MFDDLTDYQLRYYFDVTTKTVRNWRSGKTLPPLYASLTVSAIKAKLDPFDVHHFTPVTVAKTLRVPLSVVKKWYGPKVPPLAACLALAAANPMPDVLQPHDTNVLRRLNTTPHYRSKFGWSGRPVMGKRLPGMRDETPDRLIAGGYVVIVPGKFDMPYLKVTNRGKRHLDRLAQRA